MSLSRRGSSYGLSLLLQSLHWLLRLRLRSRLLSLGRSGIIIEDDINNNAATILLSRLCELSWRDSRSSWLSHRGQLSSAELILERCSARIEN